MSVIVLAATAMALAPAPANPGTDSSAPRLAIVALADIDDSVTTPSSPAPVANAPAPAMAASANEPPAGDEIVVSGSHRPPPGDPIEGVNAKSFAVVQGVDKAMVQPVVGAYRSVLPKPVRSGVHNFFNNLSEPVVFVNYLLQLKPGKAAETLGRFAINSTIGVAGLVDVARKSPFNLPYRPNSFADTFGYYGVKPGIYLYLPLIGPTTSRDLMGRLLDRLVVPLAFGKPFNRASYAVPANILETLDDRVASDAEIQRMRSSDDPYASYRDTYLKRRQDEIDALRGRHRQPEPPPGAAPAAGVAPPAQAPAPVAPPPPVFVSNPVIQPLPR